jgi:hypothetical protein
LQRQSRAHEGQHDHNAGEACHEQNNRGREREQRNAEQDLDGHIHILRLLCSFDPEVEFERNKAGTKAGDRV